MRGKDICYLISPAFMLFIQPPHKFVHRIRHIRKLLHHLLLFRRLHKTELIRIHNRPDTIPAFHQIIPHPLITARQRLLLDKVKRNFFLTNHKPHHPFIIRIQLSSIPRPPPNSNTPASKIPAYKIPGQAEGQSLPHRTRSRGGIKTLHFFYS